MRTFLGLIAFILVIYGPEPCRNPDTAFGRWGLSSAGDWIYRHERAAYERGRRAYRGHVVRNANPYPDLQAMWLNGWDDEASIHSMETALSPTPRQGE